MEGMEMGYDASRGITAMGHNLLCAAVANLRQLLRLKTIRFIPGRPRKQKPSDPTPLLPGWTF